MKIPEGWPTKEMVEAAIDNLPNVNKEDVVFSLKAALSAAPTPPVQENEPYAYAYESSTGFPSVYFVRMDFFPKSIKEIPLYTRPSNDELRKAAEELCSKLENSDDVSLEWLENEVGNLRAALEGSGDIQKMSRHRKEQSCSF